MLYMTCVWTTRTLHKPPLLIYTWNMFGWGKLSVKKILGDSDIYPVRKEEVHLRLDKPSLGICTKKWG